VISYEEQNEFQTKLDHLRCLKAMYDAGFDVRDIIFAPDYPMYTETHFFMAVLKKLFKTQTILESEEPKFGIPYMEIFLEQDIPDPEVVEKPLKEMVNLEEDIESGFFREFPSVHNFGFVFNHKGNCIGLVLEIYDQNLTFYPEVKKLIELKSKIRGG